MNEARTFYALAFRYVRLLHEWTRCDYVWSEDFRSIRAIPVVYRRAAARSYNARRYAPHVWEHDNARAKYERGWLPF